MTGSPSRIDFFKPLLGTAKRVLGMNRLKLLLLVVVVAVAVVVGELLWSTCEAESAACSMRRQCRRKQMRRKRNKRTKVIRIGVAKTKAW
jgi:hypothetical protein